MGAAGGTGGTGGTGPLSCIVQNFAGQPDLLLLPQIDARVVAPGGTVEFTIYVDGDTRLVKATLMDVWRLRDTPRQPSETLQVPTTGNATLNLAIPIQTTGDYYVDLELCASDCNALHVVYTLNRANAGPLSDAINDPYERIVYENGVETNSTYACENSHPDHVAIQ
ncbi:MAG: hypothetical protein WCF10_19860 [Polyangiales bacterium]